MNLELICKEVCKLSKSTGAFIQNEVSRIKSSDIKLKGAHDFVTYVDKTAEKTIIDKLSVILPGSGFIAEESTPSHNTKEYTWVIDPLDGTTNFIHAIPCYSISIALIHKNKIILGVIYEINTKECFYAWKKSPAFMNNTKIKVSKINKLSGSLIATGFPYYDYGKLDEYMELLKYLMKNTPGVRRLGSAAVDLAYVACGRFESFYEYGLKPWDVAAGAFIVQQAGGKVSDFKGNDDYIFGREIIATNTLVHNEFLTIIDKFFNK